MVDSPDEPPRLVVLNSCDSAAQLQSLLGKVAIAIGMSDEIDDEAAIVFAARFYGTLAEGQSVSAAHAAGIPPSTLTACRARPWRHCLAWTPANSASSSYRAD